MLYHLLWEGLYPITADWPVPGVLNVFQYITVRTAMASMTALFLSLLLGPWLIGKLREFEVGQRIQVEISVYRDGYSVSGDGTAFFDRNDSAIVF